MTRQQTAARQAGRPRRRAAAAALAAAVVAVPVSASAAAPVRAQDVRATLTVTGAATAEGTVVLARPSEIPRKAGLGLESDAVAVSGNGRAVGLFLERVGAPDQPATLVAVNFNLCPTPGCKPVAVREFVAGGPIKQDPDGGPGTVVLPAGTYRVVLLTDGAPVTVRLNLTGLDRPVALRPPARPAAAAYAQVTPSLRAPGGPVGDVVYSGGRTYPATPDGGVLLFQELYQTSAGAAAVAGTCTFFGPPPPSDLYAPGCPTADQDSERQEFITPVTVVDPRASVLVVGFGNSFAQPGGPTSLGHYLLTATPVRSADVTQIHVPLRPAAPASVPPNSRDRLAGPAPAPPSGMPADVPPARQLPQTGGAPEAGAAAAVMLMAAAALRRRLSA